MQHRQQFGRARLGNLPLDFLALPFDLPKLMHQGRAAQTLFDQIQEIPHLPVELGTLALELGLTAATLAVGGVDLLNIAAGEFLHELGRDKPLLKAGLNRPGFVGGLNS